MDGFTGSRTAPAEELPDAVTATGPFHAVRLAGDAPDRCRRRIQPSIHGHRGRTDDPLYRARRTLHTGPACLPASRRTASSHCSRPMSTSRPRRPGPSTSR